MVRENGISVFTLQDVDCTLDVNVHQELLCHVLAVRVSPFASLSPEQSRMEKHLSAGWRNTGCYGNVLQGFLLLLQQERLRGFLEHPQCHPVPVCVCFGRGSGAGSPRGHGGCPSPGAAACASLVGGTSVYLPFHHLITVPCHVAGASPWAASPV